jgi:AcrR family transcriptional regulator
MPKTSAIADLRERCVTEALAIIQEQGVEQLSLRDVARRLGVSHQAPYKHYENREALLAEVVAREFARFASHLDDRTRFEDPFDDLTSLGRAYLAYAFSNPLSYRLMFGTPLPDPDRHPEMLARARRAFSILQDCVSQLRSHGRSPVEGSDVDLDALFIWSLIHGVASILQTSALQTIPMSPDVLASLNPHIEKRLRAALGYDFTGSRPI